MRTIRLYGELGKKFTKEVRLEVKTAAEAIRALCANFKGFESHMMHTPGVGYRVLVAGAPLESVDEIHNPASGEIRIIPVISGAGGDGFGQILIGAVLIAAAVIAAPFTAGTSLAFIPQTIGAIGISLALGGVAQLLSPAPTTPKPPERPENDPSNFFNGPVNTTLQGQPVPIAYGQVICGSAVVSAGITLDQLQAGFRSVLTELTVDVYSTLLETNYDTPPPSTTYRIELLEPKTFYDPDGPGGALGYYRWKWRFYYYVETLVPL
jgi:predicted phage tail protein